MRIISTTLLFLAFLATNAFPFAIEFIHTGSGSGTIDQTPFSDATFTITSFSNADNVVNVDPLGGVFEVEHDTSVIAIDGVGTFTVITPTRTFLNIAIGLVGYGRATSLGGADLFDGPFSSALTTWDMMSSIGPIPGSTRLLQWSSEGGVNTSGGILFFSNATVPGTFQAIVPEPSSLVLGLMAAVSLATIGWRRRKR